MRTLIIAVTVICLGAGVTTPTTAGPAAAGVPPEYQQLYAELEAQLARFDTRVQSQWSGQKAPVVFSGELLAANAHVGEGLLRGEHLQAVLLEMDRLRSLGVRAVTVQISFPMLYRPFFSSDEQYAAYLTFYRRLASEIHARGLKLIVKSQTLFSKGGWTPLDVGAFYRRLSLADYVRGRTEVALTIARELRPEYLSVVEEPDTEADQTGLPVNTPAASIRLVTSVLTAFRAAGISGVMVGAGVGTWHPQYEAFARALAATDLDFIDLHVYPVTRDYLDRAFTIAEIARRTGKRVAMTEAWLYKAGTVELSRGFTAEEIFGRDAYSFWEPLDRRFLEVMVKFAHAVRLEFFSPFWTKYFHAYVDYDTAKSLDPRQLVALSTREAGRALVAGQFTQTGLMYKALISTSVAPAPLPPPTSPQLTPEPSSLQVKVLVVNGGRVAWSHARNLIAFDRQGAGGTFDIYTVRPDGTGECCLTCNLQGLPRSHRGNPAWHPSGDYIVFQAHDPTLRNGGRAEHYAGTPGLGIDNDVWVMTADGSRAWRLTRVRPGAGVLQAHFSHDGRTLAWSEIVDPQVRGLGGQWAIKVAEFSIAGGEPRLQHVQTVRPGNFQLYEPHGSSPDDRRILFSAVPRGGDGACISRPRVLE